MQTLIPAYRQPLQFQPLSSASIASREANPTVIEPENAAQSVSNVSSTRQRSEESHTYDDPRKQAAKQQQNTDNQDRELAEQLQIRELAARDREVRAHEQAHAAVGGQYASAPRYQFQRGPDGVNYAVGGEVSISTGPVAGNPQATIEKAQVVRRAALAPAEPSPQDRRVAAEATNIELNARAELAQQQQEERVSQAEERTASADSGKEHSASLATPLQENPSGVPDGDSTVAAETHQTQPGSVVENLSQIGSAIERLSEALEQRIMSSQILQGSSSGQLINDIA